MIEFFLQGSWYNGDLILKLLLVFGFCSAIYSDDVRKRKGYLLTKVFDIFD